MQNLIWTIIFAPMQAKKLIGIILAIASAVSYGLIPLFILPIKNAGISMDLTLFYRFTFSAIIILSYLLVKRVSLKLSKSDLMKVIILGIIYSLSSEFLFLGYDVMSAGIASTVLYIYPMVVAVIMFVLFKEKISRSTLYSIILALVGVAALSIKKDSLEFNFLGFGVVMLSALAYSSYMVMISKGNLEAEGYKVTFYSLFFSALYYCVKSVFTSESFVLPSPSVYGHVALFAFVTTVISVLCLVYAIQFVGSTTTAVLGAVEPVVAVGISVILFGEALTVNLVIGVIVVIVALMVNVIGEAITAKKNS